MMKETIEYPLTEEDVKSIKTQVQALLANGLLRYIGKSLNDYF